VANRWELGRIGVPSPPHEVDPARFHQRGRSEPEDPWHDHVRTIVAAQGGDAMLAHRHAALERLLVDRPDAVLANSSEGEVEQTYRSLIETLS
jgi:hypothetical protein